MKRALLLVIPLLISLTSCSDQLSTNEDDGEIIDPVYTQDASRNESANILVDVPGIEFLVKSVLIENGLIEDYTGLFRYFPDLAMVINNKEMLKDVVVLSSMSGVEDRIYQWPEIDFEKYSLVIGQFYTTYYHVGNVNDCITQQFIVKGSSKNILYFEIGNPGGLCSCKNNYFATLYPKLPDGQIEVVRINKDR